MRANSARPFRRALLARVEWPWTGISRCRSRCLRFCRASRRGDLNKDVTATVSTCVVSHNTGPSAFQVMDDASPPARSTPFSIASGSHALAMGTQSHGAVLADGSSVQTKLVAQPPSINRRSPAAPSTWTSSSRAVSTTSARLRESRRRSFLTHESAARSMACQVLPDTNGRRVPISDGPGTHYRTWPRPGQTEDRGECHELSLVELETKHGRRGRRQCDRSGMRPSPRHRSR